MSSWKRSTHGTDSVKVRGYLCLLGSLHDVGTGGRWKATDTIHQYFVLFAYSRGVHDKLATNRHPLDLDALGQVRLICMDSVQ